MPKETRVSFSYKSIDEIIKQLKDMKKEGYTKTNGVDCDCWHSMCDGDGCCFTSCVCSSIIVT